MGLTGAALKAYLNGVSAVRQCDGGSVIAVILLQNRVGDGDLVVIPYALLADEGHVELRVQGGHGDVKAVDLLGQTVGIGDGVLGGLQQHGTVLLCVLLQTGEQIHDAGGGEADVNGHLPILHGQHALAVAGLVGVEHTAVGVEIRGVHAVRQRGLGDIAAVIVICFLLSAARQQRGRHQQCQQTGKKLLHFLYPPCSEKGSEAIVYRPGAKSVLVTR